MYQERDNGGFALGIISGAIVGAAVALLFTPKTGRAMRSNLAQSVDALGDAIADRYQAVASRAGVHLDNLSETVKSAVEDFENRAQATVDVAARRVRSSGDRS